MEISAVSQVINQGQDSGPVKLNLNSSKDSTTTKIGPSFRLSISAKSDTVNESATYSMPVQDYSKNVEKMNESQTQDVENQQDLKGGTKEEIREQIKMQTIALLSQYMSKNPELKDSMSQFFNDNPTAAVEIAQGKIPEYFNVDNTAKRIVDIYFNRYDGGDRKAFVERAKNIISQAYNEVGGDVGTLPDIVYQTRNKVMEILDKFAQGEDVSNFVKVPDKQQA